MSTATTIRDIFFSGSHAFSGGQEAAHEIAFLVEEGYLSFQAIEVATRREHAGILDRLSKTPHRYDKAARGGAAHVALKVLAAQYVLRSHGLETHFERPLCGYFPDVLSDDKSLVVECGHTQNPEKMFDYFRLGNIAEFLQIPYPEPEDTAIQGYRFTAGLDLREFLEFLAQEKRAKIKDLLSKRAGKSRVDY